MSTTIEDVMQDQYYADIGEGYHEKLAALADSKNMGDLSKNLKSLRNYIQDIDELDNTHDSASLQSLQETAAAMATVQGLIDEAKKESKWNRKFTVLSFIVGLIAGVLTNLFI